MSNVYRGYAQVAGVSGSFTVPANFAPLKEGMDMTHEFDEDIIKDEGGNDAAWRAFNEKFAGDIKMRLVHTGSPTSLAAAKALAAQLTPYQIVTITGCDIAAWNTSWRVVPGSTIGLQNTTAGTMAWKLVRYVDSTQNTLSVTAPGA